MNNENVRTGAVIYVRVSTDEQADGPLNLSNQQKKCSEFCASKGLAVEAFFLDPGESARSADRPEFQRMLAYCRQHKKSVGYVVVQDLSRFARNVADQNAAIGDLKKHGVSLRSVYEQNIDESAAGSLAANIHGTFNQYFSDALSEKMRDRMKCAVMAGRFPWPAPFGYINVDDPVGANIVPDATRAPLVKKAFELIASGSYKKSQALRVVTEDGLRTRKGHKLTQHMFEKMLRRPIYCGFITAKGLEPVKGLHEPVVSEELFKTVQAVLDGRKVTVAPKRKLNPEFPLKWFVRCSACGEPVTGAYATGKNKSRRYGYYYCYRPDCRAVKVAKPELESAFLQHLRTLRPSAKATAQLPTIAAKVWAEIQGDTQAVTKKLTARLEEQKRMKSELLKAKLRGEVTQDDYAAANTEFTREIANIEEQLQATQTQSITADAFVRFAKVAMLDVATAWQRADAEDRMGVQNLLFQGGIRYSAENGNFEHLNSSLFSVLAGMSSKNGMMARPERFELPTF